MRTVNRDFYASNSRYADKLDELDPASYDKYIQALETAAGGGRILDGGCGTGAVVQRLRERGCEVCGCDVSPDFIERAIQKAGPSFMLVRPDGTLPYDDASFRVVGSFNVLEHVDRPGQYLDEMCRVLEPGGVLVIATPNMLSLSWPRPRLGVKNLWRIRSMNLITLFRRALDLGAAEQEFVTLRSEVDMAEFEPDHDAVCLTNYFDIRRALRRRALRVRYYSATQRSRSGFLGRLTDSVFRTPLGWVLGAVFIVARRASNTS